MSEKILSQEEVDALLRGVASGEVDTTPKEEQQGGIRSYDFGLQERIVRSRMPTFEMINDRFARLQSVSWGSIFRKPVEFTIVTTQVVKFGDCLKKVPIPSALSVFRLDPLRGHGLIVMNALLVYTLVDYFFGGSGQTHVKPEGRDFTMIQQRVIKTIIDHASADLEKAWQAVLPVKCQHVRMESNPQFAMVVSISEIVMVVTLRVDFGESSHDLLLVYPYAMIEPIKEKLYAGFFADQMEQDFGWMRRFKERLEECPVMVTVQLGSTTLRVRDVLNMSPGDVLMLDQSPGDPLPAFVEGCPKFEGVAGAVKGSHAFRITKLMT